MKVNTTAFSIAPRAGQCGCICSNYVSSTNAAVHSGGFSKYGCNATCKSGNTSNYNTNWNSAINHG